ncbi:DUF3068 domain-containing protein [Rhodococcus koreensis]
MTRFDTLPSVKSELDGAEIEDTGGSGLPTSELATNMTPSIRRKKVGVGVLIGAGAFSMTVAALLPTYTAGQLKKLPLDVEFATISHATEADVLDVVDTASGKPTTDHGVPVQVEVYVTSEDPSDADLTTLQAASRITRTDTPGPASLISASVDRVSLNRKTALPVSDPVPTTLTASGRPPVETPREGLQYKFPFGTQKTSYPYYDGTARQTRPINFVDEDRVIDGTRLYHFRQQVGPVNLGESIGKDATLTLPASSWGLPGDTPFTMNLFYATTRDVWVEPVSGAMVAVEEQPHRWLARTASDPLAVTSFAAHTRFDENTVVELASTARSARNTIQWGTVYIPSILAALGAGLIGTGLLLARRWR